MIGVKVTPSFLKIGKVFSEIKLGAAIQKGMEQMAAGVETESKKVTPVDTGRLRASIRTDIKTLEAIIAPHTDYALFVHEGHRTRSGSWVAGRAYMKTGLEIIKLRMIGEQSPVYKEIARYLSAEVKKI